MVGPKKDILEAQNAIKVYNQFSTFNPNSLSSFCKAHALLMKGLIDSPGKLRNKSVGILKSAQLAHIAPSYEMVKPLMKDLFHYLKSDKELLLIKSCVFHYQLEFIHPFLDGNGRMGRLWQTLILKDRYPVFEHLPVESLIKERQLDYYHILSKSDKSGESTLFIEFMLQIINQSLEDLLKTQNVVLTNVDRINNFKSCIQDKLFTRKEYLRNFKEISPATASRDLQFATENKIFEKTGDKNTAKYRFL